MDSKKRLWNFMLVTLGQTISQFGTGISAFTVSIWSYMQYGSVLSFSILAACTIFPCFLVSFFIGGIIDHYSKKRIMLYCDAIAAIVTVSILFCHKMNCLNLTILCIANIINGFMNAFQRPAAAVVTSILIPKEQYVRIGGIQTMLTSAGNICVPIAAAAIFSIGGLSAALTIDLITFFFAFCTLLFFVKIPEEVGQVQVKKNGSFTPGAALADTRAAFTYLKNEKCLLYLFIIFSCINLFHALSFDSMMQPFILARTGNDSMAVGTIASVIAVSFLSSGFIISIIKPGKRKKRIMFTGYIVATLGIMAFSLGQNLTWWIIVVFIGCFGMPFYFSYEGAIIRQITPLELQGRVFSFKDALMQGLSFIGFVCGPLLADFIFEPFMLTDGFLQEKLHVVFGSGKGSGIGLFFFICGFMGIVFTSFFIRSTHLKPLDNLPS